MSTDVDLSRLRAPFAPELVGKLPRVTCPDCSDRRKQCGKHSKLKCGICQAYVSEKHIHIDYVGHADVTSKLLEVDLEWNWEPKAEDERGMPVFDLDGDGQPVGMWIKLTVGGVTRLGYGSCPSGQSDAVKVLIGDALRNAAMRFGVALDLWAKGDRADPTAENATASAGRRGGGQSAADAFETATPAPQRQQRPRAVPSTPRPAEAVAASDDRPWLTQAIERAAALKSENAGTRLWQETAAKAHAKEITAKDAEHLQGLISARVEDLRAKAFGEAMQLLSAEDSWRPKLEELAQGGDIEDARKALDELGRLVADGKVDMTRGNRISRAIVAKFPRATDREQVA